MNIKYKTLMEEFREKDLPRATDKNKQLHLQKATIMELPELRRITLEAADEKYLKGKVEIYRKEIGTITFTKKGLKEAINQPFSPRYIEKLELISGDLHDKIQNGDYSGYALNAKPKNKHIIRFHYIDILIVDTPSQIVISEDKWGKHTFYSITQKKTG